MRTIKYIAVRLIRRMCPSWMLYSIYSKKRHKGKRFIRQFSRYYELLEEKGICVKDKTIVDVGASTYNPTIIGFLCFGARKVILQEPYAGKIDYEKYRAYMDEFLNNLPKTPLVKVDPDMLINENGFNNDLIEFQKCPADKTPCANNSIDLILSSAVLEFAPDMHQVFSEEFRMLKPGGALLHIIDLRDHYFKYPFQMLTFSKFVWEKILTELRMGGGYQNRLRIDDYMAILKQTGFANISYTILMSNSEEYQAIKSRLHPDFRQRDDTMMAAQVVSLYAEKG